MMATVPGLLDKRLVFVTGKGGVGKSTVALALALAAAERGQRTILCEVGAQEHLSHVFHRGQVGFHEVELRENLWTISIDPDESMREYVLLQLKVKPMRDLLFRSRIFNYLAAATPGLKELVTIGKIWELTLDERKARGGQRYDLVVVDAPATGHGVGFLQTPRTFANIARVGPIRHQAETLDSFIRNRKRTGIAVVALPEEMPVNETASLERGARRRGRRRGRPDLLQRPLPGALRRGRHRRDRRRGGAGDTGHARPPAERRSPRAAAPATSAGSSPGSRSCARRP